MAILPAEPLASFLECQKQIPCGLGKKRERVAAVRSDVKFTFIPVILADEPSPKLAEAGEPGGRDRHAVT